MNLLDQQKRAEVGGLSGCGDGRRGPETSTRKGVTGA
ncbi:unnamed protein product [Gulo gulo]|uniref:Uncharacterized protein n=1 Tax=Gulo gulo TaxID=48420 RepID=A0A9X9LPI6_GULGU|nr:unnamed protein product [Gulo gulo]